jgi:hypothetical protein
MKPLAIAFIIAMGASGQATKREVTVAAAANLSEVLQQIGPQFESATGIHPVFSFASTAALSAQIENGAPFDVFAAADVEHIEQLEKKGLLVPGSRAVYATGILALWIAPGSGAAITMIRSTTTTSAATCRIRSHIGRSRYRAAMEPPYMTAIESAIRSARTSCASRRTTKNAHDSAPNSMRPRHMLPSAGMLVSPRYRSAPIVYCSAAYAVW